MTEPTPTFLPFETSLDVAPAISAALSRDRGAMPEGVAARIEAGLGLAGVDRLTEPMEGLWAARATLSPESIVTLGQLAQLIAGSGFGIQGRDGRALAILRAVRRDRGEDGEWPAPESDPAPKPEYLPAPVEPEA